MNVIEYGANTIGRNLKLIRENDFEGLKRIVIEKSQKRFGPVSGYLDDKTMEVILRYAAENLEQSIFFESRIRDARDIYGELGDIEKFKALDERIKNNENRNPEIPVDFFDANKSFY